MNTRDSVRCLAHIASVTILVWATISGSALAAGAGRVMKAVGGVSLQRGGEMLSVTAGTSLQSGDILVTVADGRVQWQTPDEGIAALAPNSRFVIEEYSYRNGSSHGDTSRYQLMTGGLGVISGFIQSPNYKVTTPAADITVDGTKYKSVICKGNCGKLADGLYVAVAEGKVTVSNNAGSLSGNAGQYIYVANRSSAPSLFGGEVPIFLSLSTDFDFSADFAGVGHLDGGGHLDGAAPIIERPANPPDGNGTAPLVDIVERVLSPS